MGMLDLSKMIASKFGLQRSAKTISRHIKRMGWTRKKAFRMVDYSEQGMQGYDYVSMDVGKAFLDEWFAMIAKEYK